MKQHPQFKHLYLADNYILGEIFKIKGVHQFIMRNAITGEIVSDNTYHNLIPTVFRTMIAARLAGGTDDTDIAYGALATGAGTPAIGDTTLSTELVRKVFATISSSGAVVTASTFFGASEGNGTLTQFGTFGNGATGAADSGTLCNIVAISEVKTSSETLSVESTFTVT